MKALFFRKCKCDSEYNNLFSKYPDYGQELEYKVVNVIKFIKHEEYLKFISNFLADDENIKSIAADLYMDNNDVVHCALFTWKNKEGYLVYPSGYNYARYVAKWNYKMGYGDEE